MWKYFRHSENLITSKCAIIMPDSKECGVTYNDGSTTSNLIGHLARAHKVFKPVEIKVMYILFENFHIICIIEL